MTQLRHSAAIPVLLIFCSAIFISSTLLFWIQPLFTKKVLPILGGAPSVWNTAMVCFQLLLLAGYWYAHRLSALRSPKLQVVLHMLIVMGAAAWVNAVPKDMQEISEASHIPVAWLLKTLFLQIGLPFLLLATTATLLQRWYTQIRQGEAYWLYAVSNAGSLLGVFGYLIFIEPFFGIKAQALLFKGCFLFLALLLLACAWLYGSKSAALPPPEDSVPTPWRKKIHWLMLAAVPSSLLLGATTHITTDIAPVPLLWMLLLGFYLLSFMLAFSSWRRLSLSSLLSLQLYLCLPLLADFFLHILAGGGLSIMAWHMGAFFITAIVCHRLLYEARPHPSQLTIFYLYVAIGGALGGFFTVFLAPLLFDSLLEYPLAYALALALRPAGRARWETWGKDVLIGLALFSLGAVGIYLLRPLLQSPTYLGIGFIPILTGGMLLMKFCFDQAQRPLRLAGCYTAAVLAGMILADARGKAFESERNFYGIIAVDSDPEIFSMRHGTTLHGAQYRDQGKRQMPLSYFHPSGPLGDLMRQTQRQRSALHIGVIGLGAGSMACYGRPGDRMTFLEINPAVIRLAKDRRYFSFLSDCPPAIRIVEGDARITLTQEESIYDVFIIDAFTSDAIPVHLLTKEAVDHYWRHLLPEGMLIIHISNRYLDLAPVLQAIAADRGMALKVADDEDTSQNPYKQKSRWAVMGRPDVVNGWRLPSRWHDQPDGSPSDRWTDDYSNILRRIRLSL